MSMNYGPLEPHRFYADIVADRLETQIKLILEHLNNDEDLSILVPLAEGTTLTVESIGYQNPSFIVFYGHDKNRDKATVIVSHTSVQLVIKVIKKDLIQKRTPIGFQGSLQPDSDKP